MQTVSPLFRLVDDGDMEAARRRLDNHPEDISVRDEEGWSLLHWARTEDMAEFLLSRGADVNAQDFQGYTPLMTAMVYPEWRKTVAVYCAHPDVDFDAADVDGRTALAWGELKLERELEMIPLAAQQPYVYVAYDEIDALTQAVQLVKNAMAEREAAALSSDSSLDSSQGFIPIAALHPIAEAEEEVPILEQWFDGPDNKRIKIQWFNSPQ